MGIDTAHTREGRNSSLKKLPTISVKNLNVNRSIKIIKDIRTHLQTRVVDISDGAEAAAGG